MAMGCLLVGSSGGSVATTNKVKGDFGRLGGAKRDRARQHFKNYMKRPESIQRFVGNIAVAPEITNCHVFLLDVAFFSCCT